MCEDYDIIPIESIEDMIRMRAKESKYKTQ